MGIIVLPLAGLLFLLGGSGGLAMITLGFSRYTNRPRDAGLFVLAAVVFSLVGLVGPFAGSAGTSVSVWDFLLRVWVCSGGFLLCLGAALGLAFAAREQTPVAMVGAAACLVAASIPFAYLSLAPHLMEWLSIDTHY